MTSAYDLLRQRCGLSQQEAADLHKVRLDTIKSWYSGRRHEPDGVIDELRALYDKIDAWATQMVENLSESELPIEFDLADDDIDAQSMGFPCVGAHAAALGVVIARIRTPVVVEPHGSTWASSARLGKQKGPPPGARGSGPAGSDDGR
jgi:hypothetical protein